MVGCPHCQNELEPKETAQFDSFDGNEWEFTVFCSDCDGEISITAEGWVPEPGLPI